MALILQRVYVEAPRTWSSDSAWRWKRVLTESGWLWVCRSCAQARIWPRSRRPAGWSISCGSSSRRCRRRCWRQPGPRCSPSSSSLCNPSFRPSRALRRLFSSSPSRLWSHPSFFIDAPGLSAEGGSCFSRLFLFLLGRPLREVAGFFFFLAFRVYDSVNYCRGGGFWGDFSGSRGLFSDDFCPELLLHAQV